MSSLTELPAATKDASEREGFWDRSVDRFERWLAAAFERAPRLYLAVAFAWPLIVFVVFAGPLGGLMVSYYLYPTPAGFVRAVLAIQATAVLVVGSGMAILHRDLAVIWRWSTSGTIGGPGLPRVAAAASAVPRNYMTTMVPLGWIVAPITVPFAFGELDNPRIVLLILLGGWYVITYGGLVAVLTTELALLPVRTELSRRLGDRAADAPRFPFVMRLLIGLLSLCFTCGWFAATFLTEPGSGGEGDDVWIAFIAPLVVGVTLGLILTLLLAQGMTTPVRHLTAGMRAVARGDLDARVAVTASDEFRVLQSGFNEMVEGLRDRKQLRDRNADLVDELRASRSRIVVAADESRKRIERNIHDGAQQRLVALTLDLRMLEEQSPPELVPSLHRAGDDLRAALEELRDLARGLHPSVLTTDGLGPAINQLASRSSIPVAVDVTPARFTEAVETACYFTVAEALANVAKYASASEASVRIAQHDEQLQLTVSDDGVGGADPLGGSGLTGLVDRIAALDGTLAVESPRGEGTTITVQLPIADQGEPAEPVPG